MPSVRKRSVQIKVTLTPELHAQLGQVAEAFGQVPATVASIAIGQYVAQQIRNLKAGETFSAHLAREISPELSQQLKLMGGDQS